DERHVAPGERQAAPGARQALLELTQIGKECHDRCAIYKQVGDCVMPREGVFVRVLEGGPVAAGDTLEVLEGAFRVAVLTASDKGSRGEREDVSGSLIRDTVENELGWPVVDYTVVPDERGAIAERLKAWADEGRADLVLTTGGTGFGPRDVTPEATQDIADRLAPGLAEAMRAAGLEKTPRAMLSRGIAAIRGRTLIINLPGSPKGVRENLAAVKPALGHGLEILTGRGGECGTAGS
ncbi:MAG: molybdenum cofactor biosynthesis protein, partial [Bacillota bacterium]